MLALAVVLVPLGRRLARNESVDAPTRELVVVFAVLVMAAIGTVAWSSLPAEPAAELGARFIGGPNATNAVLLLLLPAALFAGLGWLPAERPRGSRRKVLAPDAT